MSCDILMPACDTLCYAKQKITLLKTTQYNGSSQRRLGCPGQCPHIVEAVPLVCQGQTHHPGEGSPAHNTLSQQYNTTI